MGFDLFYNTEAAANVIGVNLVRKSGSGRVGNRDDTDGLRTGKQESVRKTIVTWFLQKD